jgi:hypothetical protein
MHGSLEQRVDAAKEYLRKFCTRDPSDENCHSCWAYALMEEILADNRRMRVELEEMRRTIVVAEEQAKK